MEAFYIKGRRLIDFYRYPKNLRHKKFNFCAHTSEMVFGVWVLSYQWLKPKSNLSKC